MLKKFFKQKNLGYSLMEILVSLGIGVILIGGTITVVQVALRNVQASREANQARILAQETMEILRTTAQGSWHSIFNLTKNSNFRLTQVGATWSISAGTETGTINNIRFERFFQISNVNRDGTGNIVTTGGTDDPNTQRIIVTVRYGPNLYRTYNFPFFITRFRANRVFHQTDWSGGGGFVGPITTANNRFDTSTNINFTTTGQISLTNIVSEGILVSPVFDTGVSGGAGFHSLIWQGSGTIEVRLAFSNSSTGPWTYFGPASTVDFYFPAAGSSQMITLTGLASPQNMRYIRYRIRIPPANPSPIINDFSINWSR